MAFVDINIEPFNRLVKLAARAFYNDSSDDGINVAMVVLDALTRRQWVRENDLATSLKLQPTKLRRTLHLLREGKFIAQEDRKEKQVIKEKQKMRMISYYCLDYAQFHDVLRYRLHRMRRLIQKDKSETAQEYDCLSCHRRYSALDALQLLSMDDGLFHCQVCDAELEDADIGQHPTDTMLEKMETQLRPLIEQLKRVENLPIPEFVAFEAQPAPRDCNQTNKFEAVVFSDEVDMKGENVESKTRAKVLPPWMVREGMNLTKEQRGEVEEDATSSSYGDDKKTVSEVKIDDKELQKREEYLNSYRAAYAAALLQQQNAANERQVGVKSKRQDDEEEDDDDDVDWEEG